MLAFSNVVQKGEKKKTSHTHTLTINKNLVFLLHSNSRDESLQRPHQLQRQQDCMYFLFFFTSILFAMLKTHTWGGEEASCVVVGVIVSVGMVSVVVGMVGDVWEMVSGDV